MKEELQKLEVAIWKIISNLFEYTQEDYSVYELHPSGGMGDYLYVMASFYFGKKIVLNRRSYIARIITNSNTMAPVILDEYEYENDLIAFSEHYIAEKLANNLDAILHVKGNSLYPEAITYRFISNYLDKLTLSTNDFCACRSGFIDSSGPGGSFVSEHFKLFPSMNNLLAACKDERKLVMLTRQFWFILKNKYPVICVDKKTGTVEALDGAQIDLLNLYKNGSWGETISSLAREHV